MENSMVVENMVGQTVSHYRVLEHLGGGGMGIVYKAEDIKLGRNVALKFLPESAMNDPAARARFEREARAACALNHPNICTIYEVDEAGGVPFISMELLEGKPLRDRIGAGPLLLDEILSLGSQIAEALDAAHQRGVLHRDIKPANIFVMPRGQAKILDFGLAKLVERVPVGHDNTTQTTLRPDEANLTNPGTAIGTIAYMSPEQVRGEDLDARTDLFSLGVVLYEMATGRQPFAGSTSGLVFDSILNRAPTAPVRLNPQLPDEFERILNKALEKDRNLRYQSAGDLRADLERLKRDSSGSRPVLVAGTPGLGAANPAPASSLNSAALAPDHSDSPAGPRRRSSVIIGVAILFVLVALAAAAVFFLGRSRKTLANTAFRNIKISRLTTSGNIQLAALSPDSRYIAYVINEHGRQSLWIRQVAAASAVQVQAGSDFEYESVSFSPDGNFLDYYGSKPNEAYDSVYRVPVLGGTPRQLLAGISSSFTHSPDGSHVVYVKNDLEHSESRIEMGQMDTPGESLLTGRKITKDYGPFLGIDWSPDGKKLAVLTWGPDSAGLTAMLLQVSVPDGTQAPLRSRHWRGITSFQWLPDGSGLFLSALEKTGAISQLWIAPYPSGEVRRVSNDLSEYSSVALAADGRTATVVQKDEIANLWVAPVSAPDNASQITSGRTDGNNGLAWTRDGHIVYMSNPNGNWDVWSVDEDGKNAHALTGDNQYHMAPTVCGDRFVVFQAGSGELHLFKMDLQTGATAQLTNGVGETYPSCGGDGKTVFYSGEALDLDGHIHPYKVSIDGGKPAEVADDLIEGPSQVSPDGKRVCYPYLAADGRFHLKIVPVNGDGPAVDVSRLPALDPAARAYHWLPDSKGIAFVGAETGVSNIWVTSPPGEPARQLTHFDSGQIFDFAFSPDGKKLAISRGSLTSDVVLLTNSQ
jgi:eukaryotic-like serine/threonine-protein kinase